MGDRCYLELRCLKKDEKCFAELDLLADDEQGDTVRLFYEEIDQAGGFPSGWPEDIVYAGFHGAGDEYSAALFACDGKELAWVEATVNGNPVVAVSERGVSKLDLRAAKAYFRVRAKADRILKQAAMKRRVSSGAGR